MLVIKRGDIVAISNKNGKGFDGYGYRFLKIVGAHVLLEKFDTKTHRCLGPVKVLRTRIVHFISNSAQEAK